MTIPRQIFAFWTGNNPMSPARKDCLSAMQKKMGVEIKLVTPKNLDTYLLPDAPLHPAYPFLSYTHRSDYLRCYFMHHIGGGYSDIKDHNRPWAPHFDQLEDDSNTWLIGSPETSPNDISITCPNRKALQDKYTRLIVTNAYIAQPRTPFTQAWFSQLNDRLDHYHAKLIQYPARNPQDFFKKRSHNRALKKTGLNFVIGKSKYPIPWAGILGDIFHPLCDTYQAHINYTLPRPAYNTPYR